MMLSQIWNAGSRDQNSDYRSRRPKRRRRAKALTLESMESRHMFSVTLTPIGGYETGIFDDGAAEGVNYSVAAERLFVANQSSDPGARIDVVDASDPYNPVFEYSIDVSDYGLPTSVATHGRLVAVAIPSGTDETLPGVVMVLDAFAEEGEGPLKVIEVGSLPDYVTFTPDGKSLVVANEGQPGTNVDPEGTISVIDLSRGVARAKERTIDFRRFNHLTRMLEHQQVRFLPDRPVAASLEPEYIAVHPNSKLAWVTLQENNAIAEVNLKSGKVNWIKGLGYKDHSLAGNGMDASDRDDAIAIENWPVFGMYQPDGITVFSDGDDLYLATANEGDNFEGEDVRLGELDLDDTAFPNEAALKDNAALGRLNVSAQFGDTDGDEDIDRLLSFGSRSFSIWTTSGKQVFDSGDDFEQITAAAYPDFFNATNTANSFDNRSDDKGPEPTTVAVGKVNGTNYAFVTVERTGGIMVYDVSTPSAASFVQYVNTRDFTEEPGPGTGGDLHPENLTFVSAHDSPTGNPLLIVSYQVSGSVRIFEVRPDVPQSAAIGVLPVAIHQAPADPDAQQLEPVAEMSVSVARSVPTENRPPSFVAVDETFSRRESSTLLRKRDKQPLSVDAVHAQLAYDLSSLRS